MLNFIKLLQPFLVLLSPIIVIISAIWVHKDAKKYKEAGINIMSPGKWSILTLLIWLPFFFIYLILKSTRYNKLKAKKQLES